MIGLNSEDSRRLLAASMRGTATSWLAKIIIQDPQASLETILSSFKMRFTSKEKVAKLARKIFTETSRIKTTADLHSIIEDATYVYQARHLGTEALIGAISPRLSDVLKDKMWEACTAGHEWPHIAMLLSERGYLFLYIDISEKEAQPNKSQVEMIDLRRTFAGYYQKTKGLQSHRLKRYCDIHGHCGHHSHECKIIIKLREAGWKQTVNGTDIKNEDPKKEFNKKHGQWISEDCSHKNPFFTKIKVGDKDKLALLDTGADANVINSRDLPGCTKVEKTNHQIRAANGSRIDVKGIAKELPIKIEGKEFQIESLVVNDQPEYPILGAGFISENPEVIMKRLPLRCDSHCKNKQMI
jgi:predicted aspartyl protease